MKYILLILLFLEVLLGALLFAPVFADKKEDADALSRSNLDMAYRSPELIEADRTRNRNYRWIFKSATGLLLIANSAGIVWYVRQTKHL